MAMGVVIVSSSALGAFTGSSKVWAGGRGVLVINAAQYGASVLLQVQSFANSSVWIPMNAATISLDSCVEYPLPAGVFRIVSTGSSAGMNASLVEIPYRGN